MPRAMALFKKQGMQPIPAPTNHLVRSSSWFWIGTLFPSADALLKSQSAFYEYLGLLWAQLRGQI